MYVSPLTPQEEIALHPGNLAYVESLTADKAPSFLIDADPDGGTGEPISLVFIRQESLDRVKAVLLAEMRRSYRELEAEVAAGIVSPHYTAPASCPQS